MINTGRQVDSNPTEMPMMTLVACPDFEASAMSFTGWYLLTENMRFVLMVVVMVFSKIKKKCMLV